MPAQSEKQRRFMWLVHGVKKGKLSGDKVGSKVTQAADSMSSSDVKDFLMQECGLGECSSEAKQRILTALKALQGAKLTEDEEPATPNPIASTKTYHGDFASTLKMYRGYELTPKENQAIKNFDEAQPTAHTRFQVQYAKSDDYGNTSLIVVKKLREPTGKFSYTAFVKVRGSEEDQDNAKPEQAQSGEPAAQPQQPQGAAQSQPQAQPMREAEGEDNQSQQEIKIIKSAPIDDQEGSEILTNFLQTVYHTKA